MNTVNILVEAKKEYTSQLQKILTPRLYEGFKSIYDDIIQLSSKELEEKKTQSSSIIKTFQKMLKEIPQWNNEMIKIEYNRIQKVSNCDYIENLIEAVFITNTKILTSVQINNNKSQNIKINIPQASHFIHKCYIESAKEIYKNPYIYDQYNKTLSPKEKHNNLRESLSLIDNSINNAISDLLPIRDILMQGLTKFNLELNNEEEEEADVNEEDDMNDEDDMNEEEEENDVNDNEEDQEDEKSEEEIKEILEKEEVKEILEKEEVKEVLKKEDFELSHNEEEKKEEEIKLLNDKEINLNNLPENPKENLVDTEPKIEEYKHIVYSKSIPGFAPLAKKNEEKFKLVEEKNEEKEISNPFIKKIRQNNFLKNKVYGFDKNNSFYRKKYEENSANYNSISDNGKDNTLTIQSLKIVTDELKATENSLKIIKNKIMLEEASSDEEEVSEVELEN
jgi:hypothetical protein